MASFITGILNHNARMIGIRNLRPIVGRICNNFEKNLASFFDKSMKLCTWLVDNNAKNKGQCHAKNIL